jgi:hypothetical protein
LGRIRLLRLPRKCRTKLDKIRLDKISLGKIRLGKIRLLRRLLHLLWRRTPRCRLHKRPL